MNERRWFNQSHPQTLQIAVMLCYFRIVFGLLFFFVSGPLFLLSDILLGMCAFGVANDKRVAWQGGVVVSGLVMVLFVATFLLGGGLNVVLPTMIAVALFVLFVHPESRNYQKIWFS